MAYSRKAGGIFAFGNCRYNNRPSRLGGPYNQIGEMKFRRQTCARVCAISAYNRRRVRGPGLARKANSSAAYQILIIEPAYSAYRRQPAVK